MKPSRITIKRPLDPLHREIQARLAAKRSAIALKSAASKREPVPAPLGGPAALYALASFIRASAVNALGMGDR